MRSLLVGEKFTPQVERLGSVLDAICMAATAHAPCKGWVEREVPHRVTALRGRARIHA